MKHNRWVRLTAVSESGAVRLTALFEQTIGGTIMALHRFHPALHQTYRKTLQSLRIIINQALRSKNFCGFRLSKKDV